MLRGISRAKRTVEVVSLSTVCPFMKLLTLNLMSVRNRISPSDASGICNVFI